MILQIFELIITNIFYSFNCFVINVLNVKDFVVRTPDVVGFTAKKIRIRTNSHLSG